MTGKRDDGYHLLDSIVVFADFGDELKVAPATGISMTIEGPFAAGLDTGDDNLVMRAATLLQGHAGIAEGAKNLHWLKNLPVASGIGGGSADAAATLKLLNDFWKLGLSLGQLQKLGLQLGADVPVCLQSTASLMQGVGEKVTPLGLTPNKALLLVNPGAEISNAGDLQGTLDLSKCMSSVTEASALTAENFWEVVGKRHQ